VVRRTFSFDRINLLLSSGFKRWFHSDWDTVTQATTDNIAPVVTGRGTNLYVVNVLKVRWKSLRCVHREFSYESPGNRPHLPKLLSNIKRLSFFGTQCTITVDKICSDGRYGSDGWFQQMLRDDSRCVLRQNPSVCDAIVDFGDVSAT